MQTQMATIRHDLQRASEKCVGIRTDFSSIKVRLGELSDRIDNIEEKSKEYVNEKVEIREVRREQEELMRKKLCTEQMIDSLRNFFVDVKEHVDNSTLENSNNSRVQTSTRSRLPSTQLRNETDIVKDGIERSVKLISHLMKMKRRTLVST